MKYTILLLLALAPGVAGAAPLRDILAQKLAEYCIPKDENGCLALGTYTQSETSSNKCRCNMEQQLYYDTDKRACQHCADGYISCSNYASGVNGKDAVHNGGCKIPNCQANMYLTRVDSTLSCNANEYRTLVLQTGCPEDSYSVGTMCD